MQHKKGETVSDLTIATFNDDLDLFNSTELYNLTTLIWPLSGSK